MQTLLVELILPRLLFDLYRNANGSIVTNLTNYHTESSHFTVPFIIATFLRDLFRMPSSPTEQKTINPGISALKKPQQGYQDYCKRKICE